jgi:hypothetical protein
MKLLQALSWFAACVALCEHPRHRNLQVRALSSDDLLTADPEQQKVVFELCNTFDLDQQMYLAPTRMHAVWMPDTERGWGSLLEYHLEDRFRNHLGYVSQLRMRVDLDASRTHIDQTFDICGPDAASLKRCADAVAGTSRSLHGSVRLNFPVERRHHAAKISVLESDQGLEVYALCAQDAAATQDKPSWGKDL